MLINDRCYDMNDKTIMNNEMDMKGMKMPYQTETTMPPYGMDPGSSCPMPMPMTCPPIIECPQEICCHREIFHEVPQE